VRKAAGLLVLLLVACPEVEPPPPTGTGIFAGGCPEADKASAQVLTDPAMRMEGTDVLGGPGDVLLMNERAAFVVQGTGPAKTWFYYGGNLIDAVAVEGCAQAGPEQFGELSFQVGQLDVLDFPQSILRGFRATEIEVLSDGADGGAARVRVHGEDAIFWLVEHQLIRDAARGGEGKRLSESLQLDLALDYTLQPGSAVLQIDFVVSNLGAETIEVGVGSVAFPSDLTQRLAFGDGALNMGGINLPIGVPWISWSSGESSYSFGAQDANLGTTTISGANIIVDARQVGVPLTLSPGGATSDLRTFYVSVGAGSWNSSSRELSELLPRPTPRLLRTETTVAGRVTDLATGATVPDAEVFFQLRDNDDRWVAYDGTRTDAEGRFSADIAHFDGTDNGVVRLFARTPGRDDGDPLEVQLPEDQAIGLTIGGAGAVDLAATEDGVGVPAKIVFARDDGARFPRYTPPAGVERPLPPGTYTWTATRGYEYAVQTGTIEVPPSGSATLTVPMTRVVDTAGWVAVDTHVHSGPSEDSTILPVRRALTAAAEGVEMFVASDHEIVTDLQPFVDAAGVADFIDPVIGEELTATSPEHMTAYAMDVRDLPRGGPVRWYGMDIAEVYAQALEEGSAGVGLNHPRGGAAWMSIIDWDRLTGEPADRDPELLGMPPGAALWDWNFDFVEYMNGPRDPFLDPARPRDTGHFEDWQAFLNHGHPITAVGSSDAHGLEHTGSSRTYIQVPSDQPGDLDDLDLAAALGEGRAVASTGAFARVTVDGEGPGATVASEATTEVAIRIEALPEIDVDWFMVTYNCDEVARVAATDPTGVIKYDDTVTIPTPVDGHVAVLGFGDERLPEGLRNFNPHRVPRFTTNAIFVDADADGAWTPPGGKECDYTLEPPE